MAMRTPRFDATILGPESLLALALSAGTPFDAAPPEPGEADEALVGVWLSADEMVRLAIGNDGTFERSIVGRDRASHGTYRLDGPFVLLRDDSGLRTPVTVGEGVLEMAGHDLFRA
jgi:hypothetical protein